jgi:hypothetical protein
MIRHYLLNNNENTTVLILPKKKNAAAPFASLLAERTPAPVRLGRPSRLVVLVVSCPRQHHVHVYPSVQWTAATWLQRRHGGIGWIGRRSDGSRHSPPIQGHVPGVRACPVLAHSDGNHQSSCLRRSQNDLNFD